MKRIEKKFTELKEKNKCAFISYICAGDPNTEISGEILNNLPKSGVDIIELGVPFLDPSGDGPIIQKASKRAIENSMNLKKTLELVKNFRKNDSDTPIILMGYFNPFFKYGIDKFFIDAKNAGVDGVLIVDLPLEEENEILNQVKSADIDLIGLVGPNTNQERAQKIANNSGGFLYLISMLGITGTKTAEVSQNKENIKKLKEISNLPIALGFGINTPAKAKEFASIGTDAVVIGSTIVKEIDENFLSGRMPEEIIKNTLNKVEEFAKNL